MTTHTWFTERAARRVGAGAFLAALACGVMAQAGIALSPPPPTPIDVVVDTLHGIAIPDPYRWLEEPYSPATRQWITAQNDYTRTVLEQVPGLPRLQERLRGLMGIDRIGSRPWERAGRFFLWKKRAADDLWILYVREGLHGSDQVLLDPHPLSDDHTTDIDRLAVSHDGRLLAYGIRHGGEDEVEVRILDVGTRTHEPDRLPRGLYTGIYFTRDGAGLIYGRHDRETGGRVYVHEMGSDPAEDIAIFGEGYSPNQWISPLVSDDGRFLLIIVYHGWSRSEVYVKDLEADSPLRTVVNDIDAMFTPQFAGDLLVVLTDWEASNRRLLVIDPLHPSREAWREILSAGDDPIEDVSAVGGRLFVHYLHNVTSRIEMLDLGGRPLGRLDLPGLGVASVPVGTWESPNVFYNFQSYTMPRTVYHLDVNMQEVEIWGRDAVPFAADDYVTEQVWYASKDGTRIPMFIVSAANVTPPRPRPAVLYGYGGFNVSLTPYFSATVAAWLECGGIYAVANIRGGGEFGEAWHRAGMLKNKQNVFDDFIAAAEYLVANGHTRPSQLAIWGGSNGGLLVGAALTQRPDLFQAVLCEYPDLDMVRYYQFPNLNAPALEEYGDASDPEQFRFLYAYSPYQSVVDGTAYPAVMIVTGDADTRVPPLQARKMTARLQAATSSDRPILLLYDTRAGHAGGRPLNLQVEDAALKLAFLCWQTSVDVP